LSNSINEKQQVPSVSIGMPVFNGESFIREALDSLLTQTFTDFELIISDNASTDGTEAISREYAERDARIRYVRQPENMGALKNFQFVLEEAVGEYFMWAAADDVWDEKWIEVLLPIAKNCDCLAYGRVQTIDEAGIYTRHPANNSSFDYSGSPLRRRLKYFLEAGLLGKANPIYGIFKRGLMTKRLFKTVASVRPGGDMVFLYKLLNITEIKPNNQVYLLKRVYTESTGVELLKTHKKQHITKWAERFKRRALTTPMVIYYIKNSDLLEAFLIVLLYPIAAVRIMVNALKYRRQRQKALDQTAEINPLQRVK
jgi:glycosyltransferase involved in cell wall biosynthesis